MEKTPENVKIEHGIDAFTSENGDGGIFLEWYANSEKNLAGYSVFRSELPDKNFIEITKIEKVYDLIDTSFVDDSVDVNTRYYYFIRAFGDDDQFGEPSDTVYYTLLQMPELLGTSMADGNPVFSWTYPDPPSAPNDFIFRLQRKVSNNLYEILDPVAETIKYSFPEEWSLGELGYANALQPGIYVWWIDAFIPTGNAGGESEKMQFQIN